MKVGDLVEWKAAPGLAAVVVDAVGNHGTWEGVTFDLHFSTVPNSLKTIARGGIVRGFGPWEIRVINESR